MFQKHLYEFGPFRIDVALNRLERDGQGIPLAPKAFDLLVLLARNTDRVMSKTELIETLWPDTYVEEANLAQHVYTLRKALGDQPGGHPYIETMPRRGYRLAVKLRDASVNDSAAINAGRADATMPAAARIVSVAEGERKHATVLQCRIGNVSFLIERIGAAAIHDLTRELLAMAAEEVGKYEGAITQHYTDGFVAVFGASVVHEDDSRRAILAAVALQQRFQSMPPADRLDAERLDLQIGVSSGSLVVSRVSGDPRSPYAIVGEAARVADLLQQMAEPGTTLVGDATRREAKGYVEVAPTDIEVAGTTAFRVIRLCSPASTRPMPFARTLSRFVGRRLELALLTDLAAQAASGKGQVVSIVGEPGIGKSRLVHEFMQDLRDASATSVLEARCVSYGSLIPYQPLADLIRSHCGVGDTDNPNTVRLALEHDLPTDAAAWLLRLVGIGDADTTLAAPSPEAVKARTFDALRSLLFKVAKRAPLVLVIEDIHWIDRTSEEFFESLVERLVAARIIVVATYRPGYRAPWHDRSYLTQISLTPLSRSDGAELVDSIARENPLPDAISAAILEKAEGNPFFLEELARAVFERSSETRNIPDTVQGVIMARMDRLPPAAKQLLQTASVLGREMTLQLLTRLWRGPDLGDQLATLCRLEFLYERAGGDEAGLVFKHALTQEVAYDSLLVRSRQELHLRAVDALAGLYGEERDDLAATFAYHYARTDLVDETVRWLTRAADRAARVYGNAEAILHLDLAARRLQRLPEGPDRDRRLLEVALRHAHSLYFLGRFHESVDVLLPHEARLARLEDDGLSGAYSFWLGHMYSRLADQKRACDHANRAIAAGTRAGDDDTRGKAHGVLALEGHWSGNTADGIAHGNEAVRLLGDRPGQRWWLGMAYFYLAMNQLTVGHFEAALEAAAKANDVGKEIGDPRLQTYAGFTSGWIEASRGNDEAAIAACRRSREQAPDCVSRAYASMLLGFALLGQGDHEQARTILEPTTSELEAFGILQWGGFAAALTADAFRRSGELDRASTFVERALDATTRAQYRYGAGFAHRVRARIGRDRGAVEEAIAGFDEAARTFERIGAAFEAERTRRERATLRPE